MDRDRVSAKAGAGRGRLHLRTGRRAGFPVPGRDAVDAGEWRGSRVAPGLGNHRIRRHERRHAAGDICGPGIVRGNPGIRRAPASQFRTRAGPRTSARSAGGSMTRAWLPVAALLTLELLTSCKSGPDYKRPAVVTPPAFRSGEPSPTT